MISPGSWTIWASWRRRSNPIPLEVRRRVWYESTLPEHNCDLDRDFIPDDREAELGFDPNSRDTYGMGLRDGDCDYWDDSEITAYQAQESWPVGSADKEDWADPGKQSGG